ncbi:MAG: hypothetical protein R3B09_03025 [Nannocystaceae bacterium]
MELIKMNNGECTMQTVTVFEIVCTVETTGTIHLDVRGEERLASGVLELAYPPKGTIDEYARFVVRDPAGRPLVVGWEGPGGLSGTWDKVDGVSRSPVTDQVGDVAILAAPKDPGSLGGGASTVRIKIVKPGKGDPSI